MLDKFHGTGISFAICKRIAEQHRVNIWIEAILNQETTFYFTIPGRRKEMNHE